MGKTNIKSILSLLLVVFVTIVFQNCSADNFSGQGNGQPYEGLDPDQEIPFEFEDLDDPGPGGDDAPDISREEPEGVQTVYLCHPNRKGSLHFQSVKFGYLMSGRPVIIFKYEDDSVLIVKWDETQRIHKVRKTIAGGYFFKRAVQTPSFSSTGRISLRIKDESGESANEVFFCQ